MSTSEFILDGTKINIQCDLNEKMEEIIKRFISKIGKKEDELYFIYGGSLIDSNLTFKDQANEDDKKRNKISILVTKKQDDNDEEESLKKSKYIICPKCKESSRIIVENYKIGFYDCKNDHKISNILINDFENTQSINEAKIICQNCNEVNKSTSHDNIFFICNECKKNLCQLCRLKHDKTHNIIDYDEKFFICDSHYETYFSYCKDCKKDLCVACEMEHEGHKIITYGSILPNVKKVKEETNNFNVKKEELKNDIKSIIYKLNNLIDSIDNYYGIYQGIINSYGNKKRNYFLLQNINDMIQFNNNIIEDINKIVNEKNISIKINSMLDIYTKINESNNESSTIENNSKSKDIIKIENKEVNDPKEKENNSNDKNKDKKEDINAKNNLESNENIHKNNKIIEINKELMVTSEQNEDNNYKDFEVTKIKKILTLKTEIYFIDMIFVLKDGRIFVSGSNRDFSKRLFYVFDLKNDIVLNLNIEGFTHTNIDIIQMDDGIVAILHEYNAKLALIDIKEKEFEIIDIINNFYGIKMFKLLNQKIIVVDSFCKEIKTFIYENRKIISVSEKTLKSTSKIDYGLEKHHMFLINENEIVLYYQTLGFAFFSNSLYIGFFDIKNDKRIQYYECEGMNALALINDKLFIFAYSNRLYPVDLTNHSKKKDFKIEKGSTIHSIFTLNENQFFSN